MTTHRTARGKILDMDAMRAKNEMVRAVGNMLVNARGDVIDSNGNVINDNTKRVNEFYMKSVMAKANLASDIPQPGVAPVTPASTQTMPQPDQEPVALTAEEQEFEEQDELEEVVKVEPKNKKFSTK